MRKFFPDKKYFYWGVTALIVIAIAILGNHILNRWSYVWEYIAVAIRALRPVIIGLVTAYILSPLMNIYDRYIFTKILSLVIKNKKTVKNISKGLSVLLTLATAAVLVASLILLIIPEVYVNIQGIVKNMPGYIENGITYLTELSKEYPDIVTPILGYFEEISQNFLAWAKDKVIPGANTFLSGLYTGIYSTFKFVLDIVVGFIICVYVLSAKEKYAASGRKFAYAVFDETRAQKLLNLIKYMHKHFGGFLVGKIVDSAIIGVLSFIVFTIFDMPYTTLISVIIGVTNVIPFFGPFIGAIPCAVLILLVDPLKALVFTVLIFAIQQLDGNIIGPKILGESTGLDSFAVMFAILFSGGVFGVAGMILGVPVFAVICGIVKDVCNKKLEKKNMPTDLNCYNQLKVDKKTVQKEDME